MFVIVQFGVVHWLNGVQFGMVHWLNGVQFGMVHWLNGYGTLAQWVWYTGSMGMVHWLNGWKLKLKFCQIADICKESRESIICR